jgi:hypothetical protein
MLITWLSKATEDWGATGLGSTNFRSDRDITIIYLSGSLVEYIVHEYRGWSWNGQGAEKSVFTPLSLWLNPPAVPTLLLVPVVYIYESVLGVCLGTNPTSNSLVSYPAPYYRRIWSNKMSDLGAPFREGVGSQGCFGGS